MSSTVEAGMRGQRLAEDFVIRKGMRLLARNYRGPTGEIDLIVQDGTYVVFVEVKYRSNLVYGYPREAVRPWKQRRIKQTALYYIERNQLDQQDFRFDVVEILKAHEEIQIVHMENAFA